MSFVRSTAVLLALAAAAACGRENAASDTTAATPTTDSAAGTAPMDHANMDMSRGPAKDANHEFLRMMVDHHEGLIRMATEAMSKGSNQTVQGDAHQLHTKQAEEQKRMQAMAQSSYQETVSPKVVPSNQQMIDQLKGKSGTDYDRTFYNNVIAHHREAIRMVDDMGSRLTGDVKQMAEKMKADQQKEIQDFQRKASG